MRLRITNEGSTNPVPLQAPTEGQGESNDIFGRHIAPDTVTPATRVVDADTGEKITGMLIQQIDLSVNVYDMVWMGRLHIIDPKLDVSVEAQIVEKKPTLHYLLQRALAEAMQNNATFGAANIKGPDGFPVGLGTSSFNDLVKYLTALLGPVVIMNQAAAPKPAE